MEKLKLKAISFEPKEVLTEDQLKRVIGGITFMTVTTSVTAPPQKS